ncbi:hypothetical protein BU25DRAFT_407514 [Macroventuria anomochaeta]|uniref:Uncharacterized protein n=1 Tax=Macroventuria anomochaeta TaxID=301207 RepID=A0ACB6SCA4_9PLEO|nr:uncharacterized protein BU25DRAFT_407514 [Macroventuria anomochaeta]KAF2630944.1 hypothetical protein BU25DRAFT_407514 [Macroventuria anomochaeta]
MNKGKFFLTSQEPLLSHAIMGFSPPGSEWTMSLLHLSSMQFGDAGRGPGIQGKMPFALDTSFEGEYRWRKSSQGHQATEPSFFDRAPNLVTPMKT